MNWQARPAAAETKTERVRRLLERAIFILLLGLVFCVAIPYGSVDPFWEGLFECVAFALGVLWMLEGMLVGVFRLGRRRRLLVPFVIFCAYALAQTVPFGSELVAGVEVERALSRDPFETWRFVLKLSALVLAAALLMRYTSSHRRLRALVYTLIAAGVASALFGILRLFAATETLQLLSPRLAANRDGFAQFINRNHFAFLAEMALGLTLALLAGERARLPRRAFYAAAALGLWAALVMSNSRGGLLAMFVMLALLAALFFTGRSGSAAGHAGVTKKRGEWAVRAAVCALLLAVVCVGVVFVGGERLAERLEAVPGDVSMNASSVRWGDRRQEIWRASWQLARAHPLLGAGLGAYHAGVTAHHDASGEMALEQAHNDYLELLASGGLVGVALIAWGVALIILRARKSLRAGDGFSRAAVAGALGGLSAVALHSLFDFGLHVTANACTLVALVAIATTEDEGFAIQQPERTRPRRRLFASLAALVSLLLLGGASWYALRAGISRTLAETAPRLASTEYEDEGERLAELAVRLAPSDPVAYYARAATLARRDELAGAVAALERVAALRPGYYLSWLRLGRARERAGDVEGALAAFAEAISLAPFYAEPRWQLGNTLLRAGRNQEAFDELRRAVKSRPQLFGYTVDLAWQTLDGDARAVERALGPETTSQRLTLARYFVKHGRTVAALDLWRSVGVVAGDEEQQQRRALVSEMIAAREFRAAHEVWGTSREEPEARLVGAIADGGFERQPLQTEEAFDWNFARRAAGLSLSLDQTKPHGGARCLLLRFDGSPDVGLRFASQLVVVEPRTRYVLRFAARSEELVSGGRPVVSVMSAAGDRVLAESEMLPEDTGGWRVYEVAFNSSEEAVLIAVRRLSCTVPVCPIFGRLWLDDFSLVKANHP